MRHHLLRLLLLVMLLLVAVPAVAHADIGSTVVERFWDSALGLWSGRLQSGQPTTVTLLQEAEQIFLGQTDDLTTMAPIRDAYNAMRVVGLLLLGLCTVISLAGITEAGLMGHSADFTDWIRRFCTAAFMTMGGIHFYGLWIRVFNGLLGSFRQYLDTHWTGPSDPSVLYTQLILNLHQTNLLLHIGLAVVALVVLLVLWLLIGGVRFAELAVAVLIAPLVWPLYLLPSMEDIPKTAFRSFLGLNAILLIVVAMTRLAVRMVPGGGVANSMWNFVPAISLLVMTVFLPTMIKRLLGQGHTGAGGLMTAVYALAGLKGIAMAASAGAGGAAAAVKPPAASNVPQAPSGPSAYPVAPVGGRQVSGAHSGGSQTPPMEEVWVTAPRQVQAGAQAAAPGIDAPYVPKAGDEYVIDLGQSTPGSGKFDTVLAIRAFMQGSHARTKPATPDPE
jgi:hypothetical protein